MFCKNCGKELTEGNICPRCGTENVRVNQERVKSKLNGKKILLLIALAAIVVGIILIININGGSSSKKNGASTEEKAVQNFVSAYLDQDIDGVFAASAPDEFWDFLVDDTGLNTKRLFNKFGNWDEDDFASNVNEWKVYYEEENITAKDNKIEEKYDADDDLFSFVNIAMQNAGIKDEVEEVYEIEINYFKYGLIYEIDGKWYYGPEWLLEDALEMACGEYDDYEDDF